MYLLQLQEAPGSRLGKDVLLYSLTLQPAFDRPKALQDHVNHYRIKPGWTFLGGMVCIGNEATSGQGISAHGPFISDFISDIAKHIDFPRHLLAPVCPQGAESP